MQTVGGNIVRIRESQEISQGQLADLLNMRQPSIWKLENNKGLPHTATLFKFAKALKCRVGDLLVGVDAEYDALLHEKFQPPSDRPVHSDGPGVQAGLSHGATADAVTARILALEERIQAYESLIERIHATAIDMAHVTRIKSRAARQRTAQRGPRDRRDRG